MTLENGQTFNFGVGGALRKIPETEKEKESLKNFCKYISDLSTRSNKDLDPSIYNKELKGMLKEPVYVYFEKKDGSTADRGALKIVNGVVSRITKAQLLEGLTEKYGNDIDKIPGPKSLREEVREYQQEKSKTTQPQQNYSPKPRTQEHPGPKLQIPR